MSGETSPDPDHLFVYGSLLSAVGAPAHTILRRHATRIGGAEAAGELYDVGPYPAMALRSGSSVRGEVYRINDGDRTRLLQELDAYEHHLPDRPEQSLFRRVTTEVRLDSGEHLEAWVYVYNRPLEGLRHLPGGDYLQLHRGGFRL